MDRKILSLVVVGILFTATFVGVMGTNALRAYGRQSTSGQYVDQPPVPYVPDTSAEPTPEPQSDPTPAPQTSPAPDPTPAPTQDPTPICNKPWPARIDWVEVPENMTVNQSYVFRGQMFVQNFDGSCEPSEWYFALDTPIQWVFTNEDGGQVRLVKNSCSVLGISNVTFICSKPGNWTVTAHWAGNENYEAATKNITIPAAHAIEPVLEPVPEPPSNNTNETSAENSTAISDIPSP